MVKRVMVFSLPEGTDPDEFWKYWEETHAAEVKDRPSIRKYVINRVVKMGPGDVGFWGLVEIWCDSEEAFHQAFGTDTPEKKRTREDFSSRITNRRAAWIEEKVII